MSVFITGASSGIGEACAHAFASAHFNLILVARRKDRLDEMARMLSGQYGVQVHPFQLDITDRGAVEKFEKEHSEILKSVDVLINNAGLAKGRDPIQKGNLDDWEAMINTNIKGLLYITHALLPLFVSQKRGHIVNLGSVAGHWVYENGNVYCATKYAVKALTEGFRLDLKGTGIRVTEISPGMVETEFSEVRFGNKEQAKAVYQDKDPLLAKDIAEAVLWCVQRPDHVNIQELIIYPTEQAGVHPTSSK